MDYQAKYPLDAKNLSDFLVLVVRILAERKKTGIHKEIEIDTNFDHDDAPHTWLSADFRLKALPSRIEDLPGDAVVSVWDHLDRLPQPTTAQALAIAVLCGDQGAVENALAEFMMESGIDYVEALKEKVRLETEKGMFDLVRDQDAQRLEALRTADQRHREQIYLVEREHRREIGVMRQEIDRLRQLNIALSHRPDDNWDGLQGGA